MTGTSGRLRRAPAEPTDFVRFFFAGVSKAGTTALYEFLAQQW